MVRNGSTEVPQQKPFRIIPEYTEGVLLAVLVTMLVADVLLGILARYIDVELVFAAEMGKYLFIWLCAVGISAAVKDSRHVRLTLFVTRLPVSPRMLWITSQSLFLVTALFFLFWGLRLTISHIAMGKSAMGFRFPMFVFTAAIPVGFGLTAVRLIEDIVNTLRNPGAHAWDGTGPSGGLAGIGCEE